MKATTPRTASPGWRLASLNHTRNGDRWITWWRPRNADYTDDLDEAGVYDLEQLQDDPSYYGRPEILCVPDHVARRLAASTSPVRASRFVRNTARTWAVLRMASLFVHDAPWPSPSPSRLRRTSLISSAGPLADALEVARRLEELATVTETWQLVWACIAARRVLQEVQVDLERLPVTRKAASVLAKFLLDELYAWARIHGLAPIGGAA